jgi:hypothetical protein
MPEFWCALRIPSAIPQNKVPNGLIDKCTKYITDLKPWLGNRADAGRLPPTGFPRSNKFSG